MGRTTGAPRQVQGLSSVLGSVFSQQNKAMGAHGTIKPIIKIEDRHQVIEDNASDPVIGRLTLRALHPETKKEIGYVHLDVHRGKRLCVEGIVVNSSWRRMGVATALLDHMKSRGWSFIPSGYYTEEGKKHSERYNMSLSKKVRLNFPSEKLAKAFVKYVFDREAPLADMDYMKKVGSVWVVGCDAVDDEGSIRRIAAKYQGSAGRDMSSVSLAATRYAPSEHVYDVWWYTGARDVDELMIRALYSLGVAAKLSTSTPMRIGYRLFSRSSESEVRKRLGLKLKSGRPSQRAGTARGRKDEVHDLDVSIREVTQDVGTREASSSSP